MLHRLPAAHTHARTEIIRSRSLLLFQSVALADLSCFPSAVSAVAVCNQDSSLTPSLISSSDLLKAFKSQDRNSLFAQHLEGY